MPSTEFRLILGLVLNNETQQHTRAACYHWSYLLFNWKSPITTIPTRPNSDVFLNYPVIRTMDSDLHPSNDEEAVSNEPWLWGLLYQYLLSATYLLPSPSLILELLLVRGTYIYQVWCSVYDSSEFHNEYPQRCELYRSMCHYLPTILWVSVI